MQSTIQSMHSPCLWLQEEVSNIKTNHFFSTYQLVTWDQVPDWFSVSSFTAMPAAGLPDTVSTTRAATWGMLSTTAASAADAAAVAVAAAAVVVVTVDDDETAAPDAVFCTNNHNTYIQLITGFKNYDSQKSPTK